jgi:hypothetical protein
VNRPQLAINTKARTFDAKVTFQAVGTGAGSVQFQMAIDSTGTANATGNCFQITGTTTGTWNCNLLVDGVVETTVTGITINLNQTYDVKVEVDTLGHVNGYINGVLMTSYTFGGSTAGSKAALRVDGGANASGNGFQLGTVTMNGSTH